ncbi:MAG TPA: hypothetical protein VFB22_09300 [Candidatus Baltobacteraceae bacterium]|nr:hypothetical protein [Candidatus Baltobacteraceae bacterium]
MDRRDDDTTTRDTIETLKADTHDALDEAKERVKAGAEKLDRAVQGDRMPLGERVASHVREAGHDLKGDMHKAARDVRDASLRDEEGI